MAPAAADRRRHRRHMTFVLAQAWVSLVVLLPAVFAWVWLDRVDWIVF